MAVREIVRNARKNDGIPKTAQQSIPFDRMFPDGICRVGLDYYTKTVQFQDINYQLAQQEDKTEIFEEWCAFLNFFDSSVKFQLSFENMATDVSDFEKSIKISHKNDGFDDVRDEYSEVLLHQMEAGNNGLTKTKYLTFGIHAESMKTAKPRLTHIETDILNNFKRLGVQARSLNGSERLELMHRQFHMGDDAKLLKEFCEDHPIGMIIAVAILIVVLVLSGALTSCSALGSGINSGTVATSFTAEDDDIRQVEADYVALETVLQNKVDSIETDHPEYDEYNYSLSEISHNPFELAALLTVLYEDYTPSEVQSKLQTIFDYQYTLTSTEVVEIRTRTETRWHYVTHYRDEERTGYRLVNGHLESYTYTVSVPYEVYEPYEVEVEYEYKILNTTLTNNGISAAVSALNLTQDQMERYTLLLETRGNKPDIFGDNVYANPGVSEEYERYAVPGEYLTNQQFSNMHREAEKYLGYPYVWGGSSPGTSFDCSGFVSYVINNCGNGWNYGRLTANGWKNATARVAASDVKPGDLVFFQGTYNTAGASHVGIVVDPVNKIMIHCGNPIQYASYDTPYWRAHAYCYGRIQ